VSGYAPDALGDLRVGGAEVVLLAKPFSMGELVVRVRAIVKGAPLGTPEAEAGQ
jgi:DNA-binding response OmpR family regulator